MGLRAGSVTFVAATIALAIGACAQGQPSDSSLGIGNAGGAGETHDAATGDDATTPTYGDDSDASTGGDAHTSGGDAGQGAGDSGAHGGDAGGPPADGGPPPPVDAGPTCASVAPNHVCGVSPQCGCSGTQTCDVTNASTGAATCVASGAKTAGSACTATTECAQGLTCQFDACRRFCATPGSTCSGAAGTLCYQPQDASGNTTPNLDVCTVSCDPRTPSGACGTLACLWFATDSVTDCRAAGTGVQTDPCSYLTDCAKGYACATHPVFGVECERWCRRGVSGDCPSGFSCAAFPDGTAPVISGQTLGVCQD